MCPSLPSVQAPGRKRPALLGWPGLGDLLDLPALAQRELRRPATLVLRVQGTEAIGVEVMDHIADPVLAGERRPRDPGHVHLLGGQQHHLRPPPGHYRPTVTAHNPHQPAALIIIDLTYLHTLGRRPSLKDRRLPGQGPDHRANVTATALAGRGELGQAGHDGLQVGVVGDALEVIARRVRGLQGADLLVA
jgi:hypothetical protein